MATRILATGGVLVSSCTSACTGDLFSAFSKTSKIDDRYVKVPPICQQFGEHHTFHAHSAVPIVRGSATAPNLVALPPSMHPCIPATADTVLRSDTSLGRRS